ARLDDIVEQAVRTLELSVVAKYAFALAQQFSGFYHAYPVLKEERADVRLWRAAAIEYYRRQLTCALDLMGKPVIGVTPCSRVDDYVESVKRAGGDPVVLSNGDEPDAVLDRVDGIL